MKITEQLCVKCGKRLDNGTTWTEANKCPQCGSEVAQHDEWALYRWCTEEKDIPIMRQKIGNQVKFIGKTDNGYWLVGPVEIER